MGFSTAQDIVNRASILLGLGAQADAYNSTDPNVLQLREALASAGDDLVREFEWAHLRTEYSFTTTPSLATYTLPDGFQRFISQTEWNRTSKLPLGGPVTPQGWQLLKTLNVVAAVQLFFRTRADVLELHPVPAGAYEIALEYVTAWWVAEGSGGVPNQQYPVTGGAYVLLDAQMMVHRVRRDWLQMKGFDSTAASAAYEAALQAAKGNDEAAPVLNLNHNPYNRARLLDGSNFPPTGFGS